MLMPLRRVNFAAFVFLSGTSLLTLCFCPDIICAFYLCHVCEEKVSLDRIISHLISGAHISNYFVRVETHWPWQTQMFSWNMNAHFSFLFFPSPTLLLLEPLRPKRAAFFLGAHYGHESRFDESGQKENSSKRFGKAAGLYMKAVLALTFYTLCFVFLWIHHCVKTRDAPIDRQPIIIGQYSVTGDWLLVSKKLIRKTNQTPQNKADYLFRVLFSFSPLTVVLEVFAGRGPL